MLLPLNGPEQIQSSLLKVVSFRMNYGSALARPGEDVHKVPACLCPARFRDPLPLSTRPGCTSRRRSSGQDPGTAPTRGRATPPSRALPTAAGANAYRARRWAGPRGTRTAAPPQHRGGVSARRSPQGRRPVRCSKPRGGGGGLASMARRSSRERTGREAAMAAWSRGLCKMPP